jgi:HTH-type transcriptional regulator/antitoxin HigA
MDDEPEFKTPGDAVRAAMEKLEWTQPDLAYVLGTTTATVNQILNDKRAISHNMAKALAAALKMSPEKLARLQAEWDVRRADEPDPAIATRARIFERYPLREMAKRGWIDPEHPSKSIESQICDFFGVSSLDDVPYLAHSAKKTNYDHIPAPQLAWLFRVRQIAKEMHCPTFDRAKLQQAITQFSDLRIEPEAVRHVPVLLNAAGVRLVVVEALPNSRIDGVCFWLDGRNPVIGLSIRYDRIDNFWFVLRHECAHVMHGHGKEIALIDSDLEGDLSSVVQEEEIIANREAAEFCVPPEKMRSFIDRKRPFFAERDVLAFAKIQKVHPGLVVGQIQRAMDRYDLLRKHLVKIRKPLAMSIMMDGWGDIVPTER